MSYEQYKEVEKHFVNATCLLECFSVPTIYRAVYYGCVDEVKIFSLLISNFF